MSCHFAAANIAMYQGKHRPDHDLRRQLAATQTEHPVTRLRFSLF
jgi:hypothetical protein